MNDTDYNESVMQNREYQRESRAEAFRKAQARADEQQQAHMRRDMRTNVLAAIDELHQYLNGNVTIEAATGAARELAHQLNARW